MNSPYTDAPEAAFMAAETGVLFMLGAVLVADRRRPAWSRALLFFAALVAVVAPRVVPVPVTVLGHATNLFASAVLAAKWPDLRK